MSGPRPLRALVFGALPLCFACGKTPPAAAPVATESAPLRPPTLSVAYDYDPGLIISLRLDGKPVEGPVDLLGNDPGAPTPSEPGPEPPPDHTLHLTAQKGKLRLEKTESRELSGKTDHRVRIGDLTVPLPHLGSNDPFTCSSALADGSEASSNCTALLLPAEAPATCDSQVAKVWASLAERQEENLEKCWKTNEPALLERISSVGDSRTRQQICQIVREYQGERVDEEIWGRVYPSCEPWLIGSDREPRKLAWQRHLLPAAFALAEAGANAEMRNFFVQFTPTHDPRVEQIRALAEQRFGPPNLAVFNSLKATLPKTKSAQGHSATLCEVNTTQATYRINMPPPRPAPASKIGTSSGYRSRAYLPVPPPPAYYLAQIAATVKARTGVKEVTRVSECVVNRYWFLTGKSK